MPWRETQSGLYGNAGLYGDSGLYGQSGLHSIENEPWVAPATMRVVIIGASFMRGMINAGLEGRLNSAYPDTTFTVLDWATPGASLTLIRDTALTNVQGISPSDPFEKTVFMIYAGGQVVSASRPYSTINQADRDEFLKLTEIRDGIVAEGFAQEDAHIIPLTFRPYDDDEAYLDESLGSLPYNEEFYDPLYESAVTHADGTHFVDFYTLLFNNNIAWISSDGLHPNSAGYIGMANFVRDTLVNYYMTGNAPTQLVKDSFSTIPEAPGTFLASEGDSQVTLNWSKAEISRQYRIYRDSVLVQTLDHPTLEWTDTGLTNGVEYSYTIASVNDGGESAQSSPVLATPAQLTNIVLNASASTTPSGINDLTDEDPSTAFVALVDTAGGATGVTGRIIVNGGNRGHGTLGTTSGGTSAIAVSNSSVVSTFAFGGTGPAVAEIRGLPASTAITVQFVASRVGVGTRNINIDANGVRKITNYDVGRTPVSIESFEATTDSNGDLDIEVTKGGGGNDTFVYIGGIQLTY